MNIAGLSEIAKPISNCVHGNATCFPSSKEAVESS
jgi:hypothetical protein